MASQPPPPPKGALSLYDNLLDPNDTSSITISSAPVRYSQSGASSSDSPAKKPVDPALRFQPIRRHPVKQAKPKSSFPKTVPNTAAAAPNTTANTPGAQNPPPKSSLAAWAATEEDEWMYGTGTTEKRQRGGRKRKKNKEPVQTETDWGEFYDPTRPTNIEEYLKSDERLDEIMEWKALLYRHRRKREESDMSEDDDDSARPVPSNQFAPPPSYAAVPPPPQSPPPPPQADIQRESDGHDTPLSTGSDQYISQPASAALLPHPPPESNSSRQATTDSHVISQAPIRYTQPPSPKDNDDDDELYSPPPTIGSNTADTESAPQSKRPGQAGFAQRLMSKYGWTKGAGLGANESGILNPLRVQVDKRKKKADADGGGWAGTAGKGKIFGGQRKKAEGSKYGTTSEVLLLQNMLENMPDLPAEIADGLGQEIGEECGEKYGRVERLYIDQQNRQVFIKFTDQVSALRAVDELDRRVFNGNTIAAKFYDPERFESGIYTDLI